MKRLKFETYNKYPNVEKVVIGMHGWNGNRHSLIQLAISLNIKNSKWYFPEAPYKVDNHNDKKSWSYKKSNGSWERDEPKEMLNNFYMNEIFNKYESKNIYTLGFSQGAHICYEYILHMEKQLGGVFPISGFVSDPNNKKICRINQNQLNTPILIGHGIKDEIIDISSSLKAFELLKNSGADVNLITFNGGHKIGIKFLRSMKSIITSSYMTD